MDCLVLLVWIIFAGLLVSLVLMVCLFVCICWLLLGYSVICMMFGRFRDCTSEFCDLCMFVFAIDLFWLLFGVWFWFVFCITWFVFCFDYWFVYFGCWLRASCELFSFVIGVYVCLFGLWVLCLWWLFAMCYLFCGVLFWVADLFGVSLGWLFVYLVWVWICVLFVFVFVFVFGFALVPVLFCFALVCCLGLILVVCVDLLALDTLCMIYDLFVLVELCIFWIWKMFVEYLFELCLFGLLDCYLWMYLLVGWLVLLICLFMVFDCLFVLLVTSASIVGCVLVWGCTAVVLFWLFNCLCCLIFVVLYFLFWWVFRLLF